MTTTKPCKIHRLFIPNRGEIAVRIIRTARQMGISTVVMLTQSERHTLPARLADAVALVPDGPADQNYLNIPLIMECAGQHHADALHPGYGYLSENAQLANACEAAGVIFVGPSEAHLRNMGNKSEARKIARLAGVPLLPSIEGTPAELSGQKHLLPYPVLIKAVMGGGGKGMTIALHADEWENGMEAVAMQGLRYFGNATVYAEQFLTNARHIEVQLMGDRHGHCIHLYDRECSVQRRYQKIIEEAPAPGLSEVQRKQITGDAMKIARHLGYFGAGTIEFLLDANGNHYFLEMNTRIQVEHPVTEMITGIDLVALQLKVAMGEPLSYTQDQIVCQGHAIESRIYAENPYNHYAPSPGTLLSAEFPRKGRVDTFIDGAVEILPQFDPMVAKIIHHAATREQAMQRHLEALKDTHLIGIHHNIPLLTAILEHPDFRKGAVSTAWLAQSELLDTIPKTQLPGAVLSAYLWYKNNHSSKTGGWNPMGNWRMIPERIVHWNQLRIQLHFQIHHGQTHFTDGSQSHCFHSVTRDGNRLTMQLDGNKETVVFHTNGHHFFAAHRGETHQLTPSDWLHAYEPQPEKHPMPGNLLKAPMPGNVVKVAVENGHPVKKGDLLLVMEAMKMESHLTAWKNGTVGEVHTRTGDNVKVNQVLLTIL